MLLFYTALPEFRHNKSRRPAIPFGDAGLWSFYIFSSGGGANHPWLGDFETKRFEQLRLFGHLLA